MQRGVVFFLSLLLPRSRSHFEDIEQDVLFLLLLFGNSCRISVSVMQGIQQQASSMTSNQCSRYEAPSRSIIYVCRPLRYCMPRQWCMKRAAKKAQQQGTDYLMLNEMNAGLATTSQAKVSVQRMHWLLQTGRISR